jgi:PHD/YefM family antitoxin component YafN of YafNO toxin-antitoxin module
MTILGATQVRNNFFKMLNICLNYNEHINIATKKGNVVLMREEEYKGWKATLELCSVDGMKEKLIEGKNTPIEECEEVDIDELFNSNDKKESR